MVLIKRGHAPLAGGAIPGAAYLKSAETMREGVIREAREETSLVIEPMDLLGVYDRILRDDRGQVLYHYVLDRFPMPYQRADSLEPPGDADEARWFTQQELSALSLPPDTAEVIRLGFEKSIR